MPPQFPDFRRIRRRVKRSLNYGLKKNASLNLPLQDMVVNYFDCHCPFDYMRPEISANISHRGYADPCSLVVAMIYLDRLRNTNKDFFECSDPADLYLPALVLASKYLHDSDTWDRATNSEWAEAADIEPEHLNALEWDFVKRLNWNTIVHADEFDKVLKTVECYVANYNMQNNGVATYNELFQLASNIPGTSYMTMLQDFLGFMGFMGLVYTITLFSILAIPTHSETMEIGNFSNNTPTVPQPSIILPLIASRGVPTNDAIYEIPKEVHSPMRKKLGRVSYPSPGLSLHSALSNPIIMLKTSSENHLPLVPSITQFMEYNFPHYDNSFKLYNNLNLTEVCA